MDASRITCATSPSISSSPASGRPAAKRFSASSCRTVPTRHGTHWPHDSSRKNAAIRNNAGTPTNQVASIQFTPGSNALVYAGLFAQSVPFTWTLAPGTTQADFYVARLASGQASRDAELVVLQDLDRAMRDASICGLGHTASIAVRSAIQKLGLFGGGAR